ncbi:hypothetical protein [Trichloromonas sp.]|uniref:hypothetical protein n=1 Tax=Trichloromonas sp. TaxID=3069249 RepID=UPI002A4B17BC|nr:hypothetical protein [Trichloromonas sp.]
MSPAEICRVHFSKHLGSFVADLENAAIKNGLSTHHRDIMARVMIVFGKEGPTVARLLALVYVIQIQAAAWYIRLVPRIFEPAPGKASARAAAHAWSLSSKRY